MKILLTGASGFIGCRLAELLIKNGYSLSVLARNKKSIERYSWSRQVTVFEGDITVPEQLVNSCSGQNIIIHLAGLAHVGGSDQLHQAINFEGTQNILFAAINAKVQKLIYISSSKAKIKSSPYGEAKHQAEQLLLSAHAKGEITTCCLRPVAVFGPGMKGNIAAWIGAVKRGLAPTLPPVSTKIAMIGRDDLCSAILLAMEHDTINGKSYELADNIEYNIKEIESKIRVSLGKATSPVYLPQVLFYCAGILGSFLTKIGGPNIGFNKVSYATLFVDEYNNSHAFEDDSGFEPKQNFFTELKTIIEQV